MDEWKDPRLVAGMFKSSYFPCGPARVFTNRIRRMITLPDSYCSSPVSAFILEIRSVLKNPVDIFVKQKTYDR